MAAFDPLPSAGPSKSATTSLHGNDNQVVERRSLRDYYIIIRERLWIALPIALLVGLGVGYWQAQETPLYSSSATMQFERPDRVVLNEQVVDNSVRSDADLNTYLQILNSGRLRTMTAQSLTPEEIKILQRPYLKNLLPGQNPPPAAALLGTVTIASIRNSFLINLTVVNRDPQGAALVANRYLEQFMRYLMQNVGGKNEFAGEYLRSRAEELRKESELSEVRLQDYRRKHNLVSLDNSINIIGERLHAINETLTKARLARLDIETLLGQIERMQKAPGSLLEVSYISSYGSIPALKSQLAELNRNQANLSQRYLERHPKMVNLANELNVLTSQLNANIDQSIADLRTQYIKLQETEAAYQREYRRKRSAAIGRLVR